MAKEKLENADLYDEGSNPSRFATVGTSAAGVPEDIWYSMSNNTGTFCQLHYTLENGIVKEIMWDLMYAR